MRSHAEYQIGDLFVKLRDTHTGFDFKHFEQALCSGDILHPFNFVFKNGLAEGVILVIVAIGTVFAEEDAQ
jgi:hypothetical protein